MANQKKKTIKKTAPKRTRRPLEKYASYNVYKNGPNAPRMLRGKVTVRTPSGWNMTFNSMEEALAHIKRTDKSNHPIRIHE